ncbi:MAG: hypothetical protein NC342_03595 [Pseudoflavonifractor sp.]|nr:hypothetical protein [Alloprevotella sp.]MCM1116599.1 hypothetical protein [Pseudoflavonifractor sp.]
MSAAEKAGRLLSQIGSTAKSMAKMALGSRRVEIGRAPEAAQGRPLVVLGNGPSLRATIDSAPEALCSGALLAVNFFALTDDFFVLRPAYYVLADPHFFEGNGGEAVERLCRALGRVDWGMTLYVPRVAVEAARRFTGGNSHVTVRAFNMTAVEGLDAAKDFAYDYRLGMPRPRNVMIPSLMIAIWLGFKRVYVAGADHSWMKTLEVNDRNEVVSVQPHFYAESEAEKARVTQVYKGVRLHEVVYSFYVAFRSYFEIERYARRRGVRIVNVTPGSFIDAFERGSL